jgi:hypothetical protein
MASATFQLVQAPDFNVNVKKIKELFLHFRYWLFRESIVIYRFQSYSLR